MNTIRSFADRTAISLSLICAIHCIVFPLLVVSLPVLAALNLGDEAFHQWMIVAVIPTSIFALTLGCKKHSNSKVFVIGSSV